MFQYSYSGTNSDQKNIFESNWEERIEDFDQLTLKSEIISAIFNYNEKPTNIQSLAIKPILSNMNTIVVAPSKTGKTVSFIIGILQRINIYEKKNASSNFGTDKK